MDLRVNKCLELDEDFNRVVSPNFGERDTGVNPVQNKNHLHIEKNDSDNGECSNAYKMDVEEKIENTINWADLPSDIIENIYPFLSPMDSYRMSLVCRKWSREFGSPCNWKKFVLYLPESVYSSDTYPEVRFARKYGHMFRHVQIICKGAKFRLLKVITSQLLKFLKALSYSTTQLTSIKLIDMDEYFRKLTKSALISVVNAICSFFRSQKRLKEIEFLNFSLDKPEFVQILNSINIKGDNIVRYLNLKGFEIEMDFRYLDIKDILYKVESLETNYHQLFEKLIDVLVKNVSRNSKLPNFKKPALKKITLYCNGIIMSDLCRGILPWSWSILSRFMPDLKVQLNLDPASEDETDTELEKFISRNMPLEKLVIRHEVQANHSHNSVVDIMFLLEHLIGCRCCDHLETVIVLKDIWLNYHSENIVVALQKFTKIGEFHFNLIYLHTHCVEIFLSSLLDNRPKSLKTVTLSIHSIRCEEEKIVLMSLKDNYCLAFKLIGIDIVILLEEDSSN